MNVTLKSFLPAVALSISACGAPDDSPSPTDSDALAEDRAVEIGRVRERLGEPTCGTVAADDTMVINADGMAVSNVDSPGAAYDHPGCRNGFIVDIPGLEAGRAPDASANWGISNLFGCLFTYTYASLWEKQGASYQLVQESFAWGQLSLTPRGAFCSHHVVLATPRAGDYRVVAAASELFGPLHGLTVGLREAGVPVPPTP